jgi:hypothetical protein
MAKVPRVLQSQFLSSGNITARLLFAKTGGMSDIARPARQKSNPAELAFAICHLVIACHSPERPWEVGLLFGPPEKMLT